MELLRYHVFICCLATVASLVQEEEETRDDCRQLEKDIWKEYECCLQEGDHILNADVTEWFPKLPVLTEGPSNNMSLKIFSELYCRKEFQKLICMNQIPRRISSRGRDCIRNETYLTAKTDAVIQSRRIHYLCDDDARYLKEIYINRGNVCLRDKKSFLCTKHIVKENFSLEASKHKANCRKFRQLVYCLEDEWKNLCSKRATGYLIGLLRKTYEQFHCSHEEPRGVIAHMPASRNGATGNRDTYALVKSILNVVVLLHLKFLFTLKRNLEL